MLLKVMILVPYFHTLLSYLTFIPYFHTLLSYLTFLDAVVIPA